MLIWDGLAHDKNKKSQHVNPCQSTGVWFTEPTPTTLVFLNDLLEWLLVKRTAQWDQAAWNEVTSHSHHGTSADFISYCRSVDIAQSGCLIRWIFTKS